MSLSDSNPSSDPTAIVGTWTDVEHRARYLYRDGGVVGDRQDAFEMAEAVLVLLGMTRELRERLNSAYSYREAMEGLPEGTLPRGGGR